MYEADARLKVALFRYAVIAPLVCRKLEIEETKLLKQKILGQRFEHPTQGLRSVPDRTMRHWLSKYRKHGFQGLFDDFRSDKGKDKKLSEQVIERAKQLREEEPGRSVPTLLKILKHEFPEKRVAERTLGRRLAKEGKAKNFKKGAGTYQRWEQLYANDLWHGDTSHGVYLRDPDDPNRAKKTKLIVFIDDASRICTHGEYYFDEQLPKLVDCFGKALLSRGRPAQMLFDNAWIYHSTTMATMCAELGIEISFCRPRAPQGKGKVERFIQTIQNSFETEANRAGLETLEELNTRFRGWLNEYHRRVHSELTVTPLNRWKQDLKRVSAVSESELKRALMLRAKRKVHINTATIQLEGRDYQASADLAGKEVEVRWNPNHADSAEIWLFGEFIEIAPLFQIKTHASRRLNSGPEQLSAGIPLQSAKNVVGGWNIDCDREGVVLADDLLSLTETTNMLTTSLGRELEGAELAAINTFFSRVAPVRRQAIARALECAVSSKGVEMHVRFYIEQMDLALRRR
jgi:putative transposase